MKKVLVERKVVKETNIEFKVKLAGNWVDRLFMWCLRIKNDFTITRADLVDQITAGVEYYTKNSSGGYTLVEVVNSRKGYLRSTPNTDSADNIDNLPIYL